MKKIFIAVLVVLFTTSLVYAGTVKVKSGVTKTGTYKPPYVRTSPNNTKLDNWSTKGNTNPYTGKKGTVNPYKFKLK